MADGMANPLKKLKKIRSLDEIVTRSGQALAVLREQRRGGRAVPTESEFVRLIDARQFGTAPIIAESLWQKFFRHGKEVFFPSFESPDVTIATYVETFGDEMLNRFVHLAELISKGRIDLMGAKYLYIGIEPDWHREPISGQRVALKHWKHFDELDSTDIGNRKVLWELNRHQHFFTLGLAYLGTGDERFAKTFARHLKTWMEQNPPGMGINWSSSLEVAFRAMSWIWAFHFFKDSEHFTPELFREACVYLYLHGRHIERYLSKYYSPNTHLTGEGLGLYYLGTQLPFFKRSKEWRRLGENILISEAEKQICADGVYFEQSTWYQKYTVDFYTQFLILRSLQPDAKIAPPIEEVRSRVQSALDFLMHITMPDGRTPLIGDDDGGRVLPLTTDKPDDFRGSLATASVIFERTDYKFVGGRVNEQLLWLLGTEGVETYTRSCETEPRSGSNAFPNGGYFVMRDGWTDVDNYLIVDCGDVGSLSGGHGHADALSIELAIQGRTLLVDSGTYTYSESPELRDYFRTTNAHNTLVVDRLSSSEPGHAFGWESKANGNVARWITTDRFDFFEGSHDGYERLKSPATHKRSILFLKNDYTIMRDEIETANGHEYSLNFHYAENIEPRVDGSGKWIGDKDHRIFTFGDNGRWEQRESWISNNHGSKINAPFMRYISSGQGTQEFFTFIMPVDPGFSPPEISEVSSNAGRAFAVKYRSYTDIVVFNDEQREIVESRVFGSNFRYSWARVSEDETLPEEYVLIGGDRLRIDGQDVLDARAGNYASIRRLGQDLYIHAEKGRKRKTIAS
jgi:hypothetical protein